MLRGVCLMRPEEIAWMYSGAAAAVQPKAWQNFVDHLTAEERNNVLESYYKRLRSPDTSVRDSAVRYSPFCCFLISEGRTHNGAVWDYEYAVQCVNALWRKLSNCPIEELLG